MRNFILILLSSCALSLGAGTNFFDTVIGTHQGDGSALTNIASFSDNIGTKTIGSGFVLTFNGSTATQTLTEVPSTATLGFAGNFTANTNISTTSGQFMGNGAGITNAYATNILGRSIHTTSATDAGVILDAATRDAQLFITNASFTIGGFSGLVTGTHHMFSITYSNSGASAITIAGPTSAKYQGASSTNAMSLASGKEAVWSFWIRPNLRTNIANASEQ